MTSAQERWAEALAIEKRHGDDACDWVAERISDLAAKGDFEGTKRMLEIASKLDALADVAERLC